jgi:hypothetical protein
VALVDRKRASDDARVASQHKIIDQPFAEISAKKFSRARKDPKIQSVLAAADDHMATLRAEGRID